MTAQTFEVSKPHRLHMTQPATFICRVVFLGVLFLGIRHFFSVFQTPPPHHFDNKASQASKAKPKLARPKQSWKGKSSHGGQHGGQL